MDFLIGHISWFSFLRTDLLFCLDISDIRLYYSHRDDDQSKPACLESVCILTVTQTSQITLHIIPCSGSPLFSYLQCLQPYLILHPTREILCLHACPNLRVDPRSFGPLITHACQTLRLSKPKGSRIIKNPTPAVRNYNS